MTEASEIEKVVGNTAEDSTELVDGVAAKKPLFSKSGKILIAFVLFLALAGSAVGVAAPSVIEPLANMLLPNDLDPEARSAPKGFDK